MSREKTRKVRWLLTTATAIAGGTGCADGADGGERAHRGRRVPGSAARWAPTGLLVPGRPSVSVLMLIMPPVKVYVKSHDAPRGHAGDQRPARAETGRVTRGAHAGARPN